MIQRYAVKTKPQMPTKVAANEANRLQLRLENIISRLYSHDEMDRTLSDVLKGNDSLSDVLSTIDSQINWMDPESLKIRKQNKQRLIVAFRKKRPANPIQSINYLCWLLDGIQAINEKLAQSSRYEELGQLLVNSIILDSWRMLKAEAAKAIKMAEVECGL